MAFDSAPPDHPDTGASPRSADGPAAPRAEAPRTEAPTTEAPRVEAPEQDLDALVHGDLVDLPVEQAPLRRPEILEGLPWATRTAPLPVGTPLVDGVPRAEEVRSGAFGDPYATPIAALAKVPGLVDRTMEDLNDGTVVVTVPNMEGVTEPRRLRTDIAVGDDPFPNPARRHDGEVVYSPLGEGTSWPSVVHNHIALERGDHRMDTVSTDALANWFSRFSGYEKDRTDFGADGSDPEAQDGFWATLTDRQGEAEAEARDAELFAELRGNESGDEPPHVEGAGEDQHLWDELDELVMEDLERDGSIDDDDLAEMEAEAASAEGEQAPGPDYLHRGPVEYPDPVLFFSADFQENEALLTKGDLFGVPPATALYLRRVEQGDDGVRVQFGDAAGVSLTPPMLRADVDDLFDTVYRFTPRPAAEDS